MVNLSHAKKAQALASDLDYRKKLHDYTVLPDDMKVQQAKKAYQLQSDVRRWSMFICKDTHNVHSFMHTKWIIGLSLLEPVPIRSDLDERSRMGGWWLPGCGTSQEGRRTTQWGWWLQNVYFLLIRLTSPMTSISLSFLTVKKYPVDFFPVAFLPLYRKSIARRWTVWNSHKWQTLLPSYMPRRARNYRVA